MRKRQLLYATLLLLIGCTADPIEGLDSEDSGTDATPVSVKIANNSTAAQTGQLIVCFDEQAIAQVEASQLAATRAGEAMTRSGIGSVDEILTDIHATRLRRLFPLNPRSEERTRQAGMHRWYVVEFDADTDLDRAASALAAVSEVQTIQFDTKLRKASDCKSYPLLPSATTRAAAASGFNDPYRSKQWNYNNVGDLAIAATSRVEADIDAPAAWNLTGGDSRIVVAIIDEGVKYSHPDLAGNMWVNTAEKNGSTGVDDDSNGYEDDLYGYNFATHGAISWDVVVGDKGDSGHGTHVAGTVAAVNNNGIGVCGVAGGTGNNNGVRLMSCQIFSGVQGGTASVTAEAIRYAADNGASIIQCSYGYDAGTFTSDNAYNRNSSVERLAIDYFIATQNCAALNGGLAIFAAGNEETNMSAYPGAYRDYISVSAFAPDFLPAYYTNYASGVNIAAPGGEYTLAADRTSSMVLSTLPSELNNGNDYGYMQGTSMACPHVSGVAALGLSYALAQGKTFTVDEFKSMLLTSVNNIDQYLNGSKSSLKTLNLNNYYKQMGTGAVDAYQLLMQIEGTPCLRAKVNVQQVIALSDYFGEAASNLTYLNVEMSSEEMAKLGLETAPTISYGKLRIKCTQPGVARIRISAIAGGTSLGSETAMGGMTITKEFAIIARATTNTNGGWL